MLKQARLLTRQPRRAETRRSAGKAAADSRFTLRWSEPKTKLGACFSILLEVVLRHAIPECIAGDLEEPAGFGNVAACAL